MPLSRSKTLLYQALYLIHISDLNAIEAIYGVFRYDFLYGSNLLFRLGAVIL